jgi:predicted metal-dependent peptidase
MREAQHSAGRIQAGIRRLLDHHPLLGGLVASWQIRPGRIGTMGVSWDGDGIVLMYDPDFVMEITLPQLEDVLIHEVRHVIYGHCFMAPEEWPDHDALVIAQEVTVNEGLAHLPGKPIVLDDFPQLLPDTDTRERYAVLAVDQPQDAADGHDSTDDEQDASGDDKPGNGAEDATSSAGDDDTSQNGANDDCGGAGGTGEDEDGSGGSGGGGDASDQATGAGADGIGEAGGGRCSSDSASSSSGGDVADNHDGWSGLQEHRDEILADIRSIIRDLHRSERSLGHDAQELERIEEALGPMPFGLTPDGSLGNIDAPPREVSPHQLRQALLRMMGSGRDRSARFDRPPRRCPDLIGVLPALARSRMRVRALAVIDTSGSIDAHSLASMATILRMIEDAAELTVVECDAAIHRVYPFAGVLRTAMGGGGTDFRPPLESAFLARTGAEAVVYLTDGYGDVPESAPQVPVIWALTHNGEPPCDWGRVLRIEEK